jgi:hypothetical protein
MPFGDRTGPVGTGPMTGRAAGYCAEYSVPGYGNAAPGRCFGRGFGRGRGFGAGRRFGGHQISWPNGGIIGQMPYFWGSFSIQTQEEEKGFLQGQADILQNQLNEIRKRLDEMEGQETPKS